MDRSLAIVTIVCLLATAFALGSADAAETKKAPAKPDHGDIRVVVSLPDVVEVASAQTWEGGRARDMRQSLDAYFGLANGILSPEEVERIEQASEKDLQNATLPILSVAGVSPAITSVDVELEEAAGAIDNMGNVILRHVVRAVGAIDPAGRTSLIVNVPWNGTMSLRAPDGFVVLEGPGAGSQETQLKLRAGADAKIAIGPRPAEPEPEPAPEPTPAPIEETPPQEAQDETPGPAILLVLAAVGLAVAWTSLRRATGGR